MGGALAVGGLAARPARLLLHICRFGTDDIRRPLGFLNGIGRGFPQRIGRHAGRLDRLLRGLAGRIGQSRGFCQDFQSTRQSALQPQGRFGADLGRQIEGLGAIRDQGGGGSEGGQPRFQGLVSGGNFSLGIFGGLDHGLTMIGNRRADG